MPDRSIDETPTSGTVARSPAQADINSVLVYPLNFIRSDLVTLKATKYSHITP